MTDPAFELERLLDDSAPEELILSDLADCQLSGRKDKRRLPDPLAEQALARGFEPETYQSVLWFCIVFMPVKAIGVYRVLPAKEPTPDGDDRYRIARVAWDRSQVLTHLVVVWIPVLVIAACVAIGVGLRN
jgi:hypothetical protein